jgi:hypothetical protein
MLLSTRRILTLLMCAALIVQASAFLAFGQSSSTSGSIGGTVVDQSGGLVNGATVTARNIDTGQERAGKTGTAGEFRIPLLPVGNYELKVSAAGFGELKESGIVLRVGDDLDLKLEVKASGAAEVVNVTAEAPIADPGKTEVATTIGEQAIHELPVNGRRWSQFVTLTPGVSMDGSFGLISFRGISGLLNNNTIDGTDNNQAFFSEERGRTRLNYVVGQESIKEFQVNTQNYSAEFGRSAGGVTNAVTKSGTNQIHGSGFYYIRDTALNARNPLNFIVTGFNPNGTSIFTAVNPPDRRQQFGGTLGGPIIKDKLFWFFSYDQQKRNFPINAQPSSPNFFSDCVSPPTGLNPGPPAACAAALAFLVPQTGVTPRNGNQWIFFPKVDWQVTANNLFTASYNYLKWDSLNGIQTQPVVAFAQSGNGSDDVRVDALNFRLVSTLRATMLNEARFQYARDFEFEPTNRPDLVGATIEGFQVGPPTFLPRPAFPNEKKLQYVDNFSIIHGAHTIKIGADIMRTHDLADNLRAAFGNYSYNTRNNFSGVTNFGIDLITPGARDYTQYTQAFGPSKVDFTTWDLSGYIQDEWKVRRNVTFNYGLRYEYIRMPDVQFPNPAIPQTFQMPEDSTDLGPRVGVAWDITGNGKNVLRGGYGIYYGRIENSSIQSALLSTGVPTAQLTFNFFSPTTTTLIAPSYPSRLAAAPPLTSAAKPSVFFFANDLATPMIHQADAVFERQLTPNMAVSVSYLMSRGRRLPTFFDTNILPPNRVQTFQVQDSTGSVVQTVSYPIFVNNARPNANFNSMIEERSAVTSKYDAVVFQINRRFSHGLMFLAHFTYSRATDLAQTSATFSSSFPTSLNQFDLQGEDGRSNFDVPRRFIASAVWDMPFLKNSDSKFVRSVIAGWKVAPIVTIQDGFRVAESVSGSLPTTGAAASLPDGFKILSTPSSGPNGSGGSFRVPFEPRNAFQLPALENIDLRLAKEIRFKERYRVDFIAEAFNLFNHTLVFGANSSQFNLGKQTATCNAGVTGPCTQFVFTPVTAGSFLAPNADQSTLYRERQMQLAVRFSF